MMEILLLVVGCSALGLNVFFTVRELGSPERKLRFGAQHSFGTPDIQREIEPPQPRPRRKQLLKIVGFGCIGANILVHNPESQLGAVEILITAILSGVLLGVLLLIAEMFLVLRRLSKVSCRGLEKDKLEKLILRITSGRRHYAAVSLIATVAIAFILFRGI